MILENIDLEVYDIEMRSDLDNIKEVYNIFLKEKGFEIDRMGKFNAFSEWLQGLPSVLTVPFMYYEQIQLATKEGLLKETASERTIDNYCENFFPLCTAAFFTLKDNL